MILWQKYRAIWWIYQKTPLKAVLLGEGPGRQMLVPSGRGAIVSKFAPFESFNGILEVDSLE